MTLDWRGPEIDATITQGIISGLNVSANDVQRATIPKTPEDTGALRNSLKVATATPGTLVSAVYSGLDYSVHQHEIFSFNRTTGGPKFLERAMWEYRNDFLNTISSEVRKATGT